MAMNKKEKAALEDAIQELAIARALRWSDQPVPDYDVLPPEYGSRENLSRGWVPSHYFERYGSSNYASKGCSSSVDHGSGWEKTTTQGPRKMYSTRLLALRRTRANAERQFAKVLAEIDAEILAEISNPSS